jgi:hypothetical protein
MKSTTMKMVPYLLQLTDVVGLVDPLDGALWGCGRIDAADVKAAASADQFETRAWDQVKDQLHGPNSREFHIQRVAYFVRHGLPDDEHNIRLTVDGLDPSKPIRIDNGNHRIAASLVRSDTEIKVLLYYFDIADVERYLPNAKPV